MTDIARILLVVTAALTIGAVYVTARLAARNRARLDDPMLQAFGDWPHPGLRKPE